MALCGLLNVSAGAAPLLTSDQNPLTAIYGLPPPHAARLAAPGSIEFTVSTNISNTLNIDVSPDELLFIDGEIHRVNLILDIGLSERWGMRLLLPWIEHVPGFMDRPIDRFHEIFNLREGDRPLHPRDRLLYSFEREGEDLLYLDSSQSGPGDLQLMIHRQLHRGTQAAYSVAMGVKAPSGDSAKLTGSGATDTALWTAAQWGITTNLDASATAGLLFPGRGDILADYQSDRVAFGHAGLQWRAWPDLALKCQFDWHTRFYENIDSIFLGDVQQLSCGGTWGTGRNLELDFSITEDIKIDASPDATLNLSLRFKL